MGSEPAARRARLLTLAGAVLAYFVVFPGDLAAIVTPVESLLGLSRSIAPGLYALIVAGVLAWAALRIWGPSRTAPTTLVAPPPRELRPEPAPTPLPDEVGSILAPQGSPTGVH